MRVWVAETHRSSPCAVQGDLMVDDDGVVFVRYESDGGRYETPLSVSGPRFFPTEALALAEWSSPNAVKSRALDVARRGMPAPAQYPKWTGD